MPMNPQPSWYQPPKPAEPEPVFEPAPLEEIRVYEWTVEQLDRLGFSRYQARVLADLRVGWHEADRMLGRCGGDHDMAFDQLS